jgi:hypothetical protein
MRVSGRGRNFAGSTKSGAGLRDLPNAETTLLVNVRPTAAEEIICKQRRRERQPWQ